MLLVAGLAAVAVLGLVLVGVLSRDGGGGGVSGMATSEGKVLGSATAPVTLTAWEDFQCPFCRTANETMLKPVVEQYVASGSVQIHYRHFAFLGAESIRAAAASECAAEQGLFWEYHDELFAHQSGENRGAFSDARLKELAAGAGLDRDAFDACVEDGRHRRDVEAETAEGRRLGVDSTPTFFVNDVRIDGVKPFSVVKEAIEKALAAR
jgi:protein-disulfide isomerase